MKIYDNGEKLLGMVKDLKEYILSQDEDEELNAEILEELNELNDNAIVSINYDFGMGFLIDVWDDKDIVEIKETKKTMLKKYIKAMEEIYHAMNNLDDLIVSNQILDFNDIVHFESYPFNESFDDTVCFVEAWIEQTKEKNNIK